MHARFGSHGFRDASDDVIWFGAAHVLVRRNGVFFSKRVADTKSAMLVVVVVMGGVERVLVLVVVVVLVRVIFLVVGDGRSSL